MDEMSAGSAFGTVVCDLPTTLRAGDAVRWRCRLQARREFPAGALLGFARRWPSDWGLPQSTDQTAPDFLEVARSPDGAIRWWSARAQDWHPFDHLLFVELIDPLPSGGCVELRFGGEGPGQRVQTFYEEQSILLVRLRLPDGGGWLEIDRPSVRIEGGMAARLVVTAPSIVAVGESFELHLRLEDRWGNPATGPAIDISVDGIGAPLRLGGEAGPVGRVSTTLPEAGVRRIGARDAAGLLAAESNPVRCVAAPAERLYWGDIHAQSAIGCGARAFEGYLAHARDVAALDFTSHQANCFLVSNAEWAEQQAATKAFNEPGRFVTLLGLEWSGKTAVGGDRNIYFPGDEAPLRRCSHEYVEDHSDIATDLPHVTDLHAHYRSRNVLGVMHVGGRTTNLAWHEPSFERLLEVHSTHATSEWFLMEALERGYRCGVTAGSDGVDGRPGTSHPGRMSVRNQRGGLVAVAMPGPTRQDLWEALKARRCYGTTGQRILLSVLVDGQPMGTDYRAGAPPVIEIDVEGTAPLEAVELFRGRERIFTAPLSGEGRSDWIRVAWQGLSARGNFSRARMVWDGGLEIEHGRLRDARGWAFDTPEEGIEAQGPSAVRWRSVTAGDWDGVVLRLDEMPGTALRFTTAPLTFRLPLTSLVDGACEIAAEEPMRRVRVERLPATPPPLGWAGQYRDNDAPPGEHPYWVRVRQADGGLAWSSPIFVTLEP